MCNGCECERSAQKFLQQVFTPEVTLDREREEGGGNRATFIILLTSGRGKRVSHAARGYSIGRAGVPHNEKHFVQKLQSFVSCFGFSLKGISVFLCSLLLTNLPKCA